MKIIVTGAAGFIGSHLLDYLLGLGYEVVGIDNYSVGNYQHTAIKRLDLLKNQKEISKLISTFKPKVIYHLAAWAHEGLSQFSPTRIIENNLNAYLTILIPAINSKVKKIILFSSMSVYGNQKPPFTENMDRKPIDIYGVAKTAMEQTTEILADVHNFEYVILRLHNVYGPRQNMADPYRNVIAIFINCLLRRKSFYIYGDGEQKRAFSYIDELIPYLAKVGWEDVANKIINIGSSKPYTINQLANEILKHFINVPAPIYLPDRPQEVKNAYASSKMAQKLLSYKDQTSFQEGIKKMVYWAKSVGPVKQRYLKRLELLSHNTPRTWRDKLI